MTFRFATQRENYGDYASGQVFHNLPGHPALTVRLASEVFQRCLQLRRIRGLDAPVRLYDPCCGGAYHLAVLAYLHWEHILDVKVSDIDDQALAIARRNLALLTLAGLEERMTQIEALQHLYKKESHLQALRSAEHLKTKLLQHLATRALPVDIFQADALRAGEIQAQLGAYRPDLVISDIPYGMRSHWQLPEGKPQAEPVWLLLENLRDALGEGAVVAIAADKQQKIAHAAYQQLGRFKLGKRQVVMMMEKQ